MKENCKFTCNMCPPPMAIVPEVKPMLQPENADICLSDDRTINVNDYESDYSYDSDYSDDDTCATVQEYPISIKQGKYTLYNSDGSCQVYFIILFNVLTYMLESLSTADSSYQPCCLSSSKH